MLMSAQRAGQRGEQLARNAVGETEGEGGGGGLVAEGRIEALWEKRRHARERVGEAMEFRRRRRKKERMGRGGKQI